MLVTKTSKKCLSKSNAPTKSSLTYPKEILTTFSDKKVFPKSKKDPNQREVISEPTWPSPCQLFTQEATPYTVSEEDKFASTAKVPVIQQELFILVQYVAEPARWSEKSRSKTKSRMFRWNVRNAMELDMLVNTNALFVMDKRLLLNQETCILKCKRVWGLGIKYCLRANLSKDLSFTRETFT